MSERRRPSPNQQRPSPIQPPFFSSVQDENAKLQRGPSFPTSNFLGRPENRRPPVTGSLPPIQSAAASQHDSRTFPPIQLPPLRPPNGGSAPPSHSLSKQISIHELLQGSPPANRVQQPQAQFQPPHRGPVQRAALHGYGGPPSDPRVQHTYHEQSLHRIPQGPPPSQHPQAAPIESYPRFPPGYMDSNHAQRSPAVTSVSSRSWYGSEEPSPRTSIAPPTSFPVPQPQSRVSQPPPLKYNLSIRQQPAAARACGFGERDRRVIDPPPIIELKITDRQGNPEQDPAAMLALHCTLLSPDGRDDETEVPPTHPHQPTTRRLMGTLVASPYQAKDENATAGTFFVFPDLSCRSPGKYRLHCKLLRIDPREMHVGFSSPSVATMTTDIFNVYTAKDFPGMRASSALLKSLRRQGLNVGVKKGSEARKGKGRPSKKEDSSSEDDDSEESDGDERRGSGGSGSTGDVSPKTQPAKKSKRKRRNQ